VTSTTLVDLLRQRADESPERLAFVFLGDDGSEHASLTYAELDRRARAIAAVLQADGHAGERALLLYPPGLEFVCAYFGCLYAGVVAVPAYPPRQSQKQSRLSGIISDARPAALLAPAAVIARIRARPAIALEMSGMASVASDAIADERSSEWSTPALRPDDLAFLQYTSGSTSAPKGVMVSHRNLLHNSACIRETFDLSAASVSVTWLPSYHDMGLIDGIIQPIFSGFPAYLMAPASFLQQPVRWLEAISHYRATHSGGPDFAYSLCASKISLEQRTGLDLSCWSSAYNGAEPIRLSTQRRFAEFFAPCGFQANFFCGAYGLAEATLMVAAGALAPAPAVCELSTAQLEQHRVAAPQPGERATRLVGCGEARLGTRIVIVDPETRMRCGPDRVGEIWVGGPSVAGGYWNAPEQTEHVFRAHLADSGEGPFLRTGDLGILRDAELFVTGRLKDMFILRGRNHYPHDLELTAERSVPVLRAGYGAAFTVPLDDEGEGLVIAYEVERTALRGLDAATIALAVRRAAAGEHELQVHAVVLLRPGTVPRTSSGKIQRQACRAQFLGRTLDEVGRSVAQPGDHIAPEGVIDPDELLLLTALARDEALTDYLRGVLAPLVAIPPDAVQLDVPLVELGLDSLGATTLKHRLETDLRVIVPLADVLQDADLRALAERVGELLGSAPFARSEEPRANETGPSEFALSLGQQSLWFLHALAPRSAALNVFFAVRTPADTDVAALTQAVRSLGERHPALRTSFASTGQGPVQRVVAERELRLELTDTRGWGEHELDDYLAQCAHRPFDLQDDVLFRAQLCRRADGYVFLVSAHHIVADFRSLVVLLDELRDAYAALSRGHAADPLPPPPDPGAYVRREARFLEQPAAETQFAYWQRQLAGLAPGLDIPTDRPRVSSPARHGAVVRFSLGPQRTEHLRRLARTNGVTLYVLLLAAFQVLLHRYSGQDDLAIGTSVDARGEAEFARTVGYLVNQLVLRADLSGKPTFAEFLQRSKRTVLEGLQHADLPFAALVRRLAPERGASSSPLFNIMFVLEQAHRAPETDGLPLQPVPIEHRSAQFDLTLTVIDDGAGVVGTWEYDRNLFDAATAQRMVGHFITLLDAVAEDPSRPVTELPMLSADEQRRLVSDWNMTAAPYPDTACAHELFEAQAERSGGATAVVHGQRVLTYAELNAGANRLAHRLVQLGVGRGAVVAIYMPRSPEMVTALLGILKAGAAYLPLDPEHPQARLAAVLDNSGATVVLTQSELVGRLPERGPHAICHDADTLSADGAADEATTSNPAASARSEDLAYVIYTSGSTGVPKGVMIPHRGLVNYASWAIRAYEVACGSGAPVNSSLGFDATITSLLVPLLAGKRVVLVPEQREIAVLAAALRAGDDFSLVKITPAHLELLRNEFPPDGAGVGTRALIVGGEALSLDLAAAWARRAPGTRIVNEYGPTETVVGCCVHEIDAQTLSSGVVPIGRPIANTELYVLDDGLQPVPIGVSGGLYVGGAGVARGYLGNPTATAEKFVPDPFSGRSGARMYQTGDVARYRSDGTLEFLGRSDDQVKLRGFRVELGEVEAALRRQPAVREAAVIVRRGVGGDTRLFAYVVPNGGHHVDATELQHSLERTLPKHMIPAAFIGLEQLPLTRHGKVDKGALPTPSDAPAESAGVGLGLVQGSILERAIAQVWRAVLQVDEVGLDDNFFDLGGHSLMMVAVQDALQQRLERPISVLDLLEFPSIRSLAAHLRLGEPEVADFQDIRSRAQKRQHAALAIRSVARSGTRRDPEL
jgi:amino acid adenylation domain-containing protein